MSLSESPCPSRSFALPDLAATVRLARRLAALAEGGDVIALSGDLGAGKTTFARAFINALERPPGAAALRDDDVPSPTFTLVQLYERLPASVWHFDLYRLEKPQEAFELGIEEAFSDGISLIEWPERLGRILPPEALRIELKFAAAPEARVVELSGSGARAAMLIAALPEDSEAVP